MEANTKNRANRNKLILAVIAISFAIPILAAALIPETVAAALALIWPSVTMAYLTGRIEKEEMLEGGRMEKRTSMRAPWGRQALAGARTN